MKTVKAMIALLTLTGCAAVGPVLDWFDAHGGAITALFTVVLAFSTIALWLATKGLREDTLDSIKAATASAAAAAKANELTSQNFVALHRPWVSVRPAIASGLSYDERGDGHVTIQYELRNTGSSPAINIDIESAFYIQLGGSDPVAEQKRLANNARARSPGAGSLGHTLFPGDTLVIGVILPIPDADVQKMLQGLYAARGTPRPPDSDWFSPVLVGCVDYKFTFAEGHHQTGFILGLHKNDPQKPMQNMFRRSDGDVPPAHLRLFAGFFGAGAD